MFDNLDFWSPTDDTLLGQTANPTLKHEPRKRRQEYRRRHQVWCIELLPVYPFLTMHLPLGPVLLADSTANLQLQR